MELKLGFNSYQDIAEWMGVSYGQFRNTKKDKLELLKNFAEYTVVNKGVNITNIINPVFSKKGSKAKEVIVEHLDETWGDLNTAANVNRQLRKEYKNDLTIQESTSYNYVLNARNEFYGKPGISNGSLGSCEYVWAKDEGDKITPLSENELKIKDKLLKKYYGNTTEKQLFVAAMIEEGEITKEEGWEVLDKLTGISNFDKWWSFKGELEATLKCKLLKATAVERMLLNK